MLKAVGLLIMAYGKTADTALLTINKKEANQHLKPYSDKLILISGYFFSLREKFPHLRDYRLVIKLPAIS